MNKPVRVILLDEADSEYKKLNEIVGQQIKEGKVNQVRSTKKLIRKGAKSQSLFLLGLGRFKITSFT